ncbi:anthrone oxygenase family protein [Streptomyces purpureus]|uniref:Membrane protein n=1 Tax=Streptomyces purpureus TaxID=1951 RepID=A0A918GZP9_9ACTN|nr:anthrone oxygenase family protein [Streptomyces purpureus]GGT28635.1 membrane protein [Streptomyces purpureus]
MPTTFLALAIGFTGLYAGFMLIFLTGIMPALARLTDGEFVTVMRRINEYVPKAVFMVVFIGLVVFPALALAVPVEGRSDTQFWLVLAGLVCAVLNHLVTMGGNVPLNNALAASEGQPASAVRAAFEARWNRLHLVRTVLVTAAFGLLIAAALT